MERATMIASLAEAIDAVAAGHATRVAIDGRSAAGKSTLTAELAVELDNRGRHVHMVALDDFHPLGYVARGTLTPAQYYEEGYEFEIFRQRVLEPLGDASGGRILSTWAYAARDVRLPERLVSIAPTDVVLIDGAFLGRADFAVHFDYRIWVEVDWTTMVERAARRDVAWVGDADKVRHRYRSFWIPMHQYYEGRDQPQRDADACVHNEPVDDPSVRFATRPGSV